MVLQIIILNTNSTENNFYITSPDIIYKNGEITIDSQKWWIRAQSSIYKGKNWKCKVKIKWGDGKYANPGIYFNYWHHSSCYFLELSSYNKLIVYRATEDKQYSTDLKKLKETDFLIKKGIWYEVEIIRNDDFYRIIIDGKECLNFKDKSSYNPDSQKLLEKYSLFVNNRHPYFNGGFAFGFNINGNNVISNKSMKIVYKDIKITGDPYNGEILHHAYRDIRVMNEKVRLSILNILLIK